MPLRVFVDPGGELYLPFARDKLSFWHKEMLRSGQRSLIRTILVDSATRIFVYSVLVGRGTFLDRIRITHTPPSGWDFLVTDFQSFAGGGFNVFIGSITAAELPATHIGDNGAGSLTAGKSSNKSALISLDATDGWKWVDDKKVVSSYEPASFGGFARINTADGTLVAVLTNGGVYRLSDGTNFISPTAPTGVHNTGSPYVLATKADGYFITETGSAGVSYMKTVSLITGTLSDLTLSADTQLFAIPAANYTDVFAGTWRDLGSGYWNISIYRAGVLDYFSTAVGFNFSPQSTLCTRDGVHLFIDSDFAFGGVGVTGTVHVAAVRGQRQADGTYAYSEATVTFDTDFYDVSVMAFGRSDTLAFAFLNYWVTDANHSTLKVVASDGTVQVVAGLADAADVATAGVRFFSAAFTLETPLNFLTKSAVTGSRDDGTGFRRAVFFAFSDGTYVTQTLPPAARNVIATFAAGSRDTAYAYLSDTSALRYLFASDGTLLALADPPTIAATDTAPARTVTAVTAYGFVEKQSGCALLFAASRSSGQPTYHHWDETGAIFDYAEPALAYTLGRTITIPTPSSIHRMELIEAWA